MLIQMGTNMAAGNQQKHLSLSFATSVNLSLEELENIKIIFSDVMWKLAIYPVPASH